MMRGMSLMALKTSLNGVKTFNGVRRISSNSSFVGGISGVVFALHQTEPTEQIDPSINEAKTQFGILPVCPIMIKGNRYKEKLARVCPKPVKKLCAWKPVGCWLTSNLSATKA